MELKSYLAILLRRRWVIIITTAVTVLVTAFGVSKMSPMYEASTTLRVAPAGSSYTDFTYATQLKNTLIRIATSDLVLNEVALRVNLEEPPKLTMEILGSSQLMLLTVEHKNPRLAQQAANTAAEILTDLHGELYVKAEATYRELLSEQVVRAEQEWTEARLEFERISAESPDDEGLIMGAASELEIKRQAYSSLWDQYSDAQIRETLQANAFTVFEPASLPENPSGLAKELYVALGGVLGFTAGLGLAFLFENLDSTLHTTRQIEAVTQLSTLGKIPSVGRKHRVLLSDEKSLQEEAFRRLRTNIYALSGAKPFETLLVTSAEPKEGKSTIVANLAFSMAESGHKVVAVDCDLRRPTLHKIFNLGNEMGLSNILQKKSTLDAALKETGNPNLRLICAGPLPSKSAELIGSQAMDELLDKLRNRFDIILLDTPAIVAVADAAILAPRVQSVLLVVRRGKVGEEAVWAACQQLANVGTKPIGVVVNRARKGTAYGYYPDYMQPPPVSVGDPLTKINGKDRPSIYKPEYKQAYAVSGSDPLTLIRGIGPTYEKALRALGIMTFAQLGEQDPEELAERIGRSVWPAPRITAKQIYDQRWIEQARQLSHREVRK